ncbi:hypothetical protein [Nonlabens sp. Asnod3-A02]|uniref:hypothetical protein n=1 Tax=Nonlabens sp. Asnod3-A02 TaxID=3160579 RepID=UPI00386B9EF2
MKTVTIIGIIVFLFITNRSDKYFEGRITYKQTYTSEKINTDSLANVSPNGNVYEINHRYYRGLTYAKDSAEFILDGQIGRSLYKTRNQLIFTCYDHTQANSKIGAVTQNDSIEIINGFRCKSFEITSNGRKSIYYYSLDYKMHPTIYSKYAEWNWKDEMELANGGITIKSIHQNDMYNLIIEIESIEEIPFKDNYFYVENEKKEDGC